MRLQTLVMIRLTESINCGRKEEGEGKVSQEKRLFGVEVAVSFLLCGVGKGCEEEEELRLQEGWV